MTDAPKHPAKFSDVILDTLLLIVEQEIENKGFGRTLELLDPFAGVGRIHELEARIEGLMTWGIEIEPEWAAVGQRTYQGDARRLQFGTASIDIVATSPTYGNRMADHFDAKDESRRMTYRHSLGRSLHEANSGRMKWGREYRRLHVQAWREARRVLRPRGLFILNISDHVAAGEVIPVTDWHVGVLDRMGFTVEQWHRITTPRMRFGANHQARIDHENVIVFRRP